MSELMASIAKEVPEEVAKMVDVRAIQHIGATVYVESGEIEYLLYCTLGDRTTRVGELKRVLAAILSKPVVFPYGRTFSGFGIPLGEDLVGKGLIKQTENGVLIDIQGIYQAVESNIVVINIRQPFPRKLIEQMVEVHVNQSAGRAGGKMTYFMEIVIINQSTWATVFRSLNLRDIPFQFNLEQMSGFITESLPVDFLRHFKFATRARMGPESGRMKYERVVKGYAGDAQSFLAAASAGLMNYAVNIMPREIIKNITFDPPSDFKLISVDVSPTKAQLAGMEFPLIFLPDKLSVRIETNLNHGPPTKVGTAAIDLEAMRKSVRDVATRIRQDSLKLSKKGGVEIF